jgi:DNA end-binding protein Ku
VPGGEEAFAVIRDAMKDKDRVALARIVFANREHVMAIEPWGKGLLATTLRYDYEVRDEREAFKGIPSPRVAKEMVELASHILDKKSGHFDPAKFKDEYELALRKLVKRKAAGKTIERPEPAEDRSNVIDLMAALRESVGRGAHKGSAGRKKGKGRAGRRKAG